MDIDLSGLGRGTTPSSHGPPDTPRNQGRSFPSQGSGFADANRRGSPHCPQSLPCHGLTQPERSQESPVTNDLVHIILGSGWPGPLRCRSACYQD